MLSEEETGAFGAFIDGEYGYLTPLRFIKAAPIHIANTTQCMYKWDAELTTISIHRRVTSRTRSLRRRAPGRDHFQSRSLAPRPRVACAGD